jgi:hypothetical protein
LPVLDKTRMMEQTRLREAVSRRLSELGVAEPRVAVERREGLLRSAGGKLQLVVAGQVARGNGLDPRLNLAS